MQRLAVLVPRARLHLIRFDGVLAPNVKLRARVVPSGPHERADASEHAACECGGRAHHGRDDAAGRQPAVMGRLTVRRKTLWLGWAAVLLMSGAVLMMGWEMVH